ncbi:unnamed protein product [Bursaphelenchus okinawaensis]|uniref:Uncharacterized protein n=1 Tax=Bursaphelenchus okinawaensis TaxID=465554 RepID=A0A811L8H8_9BILA|nr:unnamed protein product [Bursaphelenchus okinawaensis]CAG9118966.1 unnamed protein product [Bursaphelenchus okinawaensis]
MKILEFLVRWPSPPQKMTSNLIPASLIESGSNALPALFLEARIHGQPDQLITQLGLSLTSNNVDVAVFIAFMG